MTKNCKGCGNEFEPSGSTREYCSKLCALKEIGHAYKDAERAYILENYGKIPTANIAAKMGTTAPLLRRVVSYWRLQGVEDVPSITRNLPIGATTVRKEKGKEVTYIKTVDGWKRMLKAKSATPKPVVKKAVKPREKYVTKAEKKRLASEKKREVKPFKKRVQDMSKLQAIYIPQLKATVFADKNKPKEQVIARYMQQHEDERKGHYSKRGILV